MSGKNGKVRW